MRIIVAGIGVGVACCLVFASLAALDAEQIRQTPPQTSPPAAKKLIRRVWLTHKSNTPDKIVINWETQLVGDSVVRYGRTAKYGKTVRIDEKVTLHHVKIPLPDKGGVYHYSVASGDRRSSDATFKGYPTDTLRVAIAANWQRRADLSAILKDDVHLLISAGDNISSIRQFAKPGAKDATRAYSKLIDSYPKLFASVPFMPALGNHDREIRPRGKKYPPQAVYDIEAAAFRAFFELPDDEWKWRFDIPDFGVRFIALDLNHVSDFGTTWQSSHSYKTSAPQYKWYRKLIDESKNAFVVTIYNERNATVRSLEKGSWGRLLKLKSGSITVSGFGYFCERAEAAGRSFYNISLNGKGDKYPDPKSKFLASENCYLLLTFQRGAKEMTAELKQLETGKVLHWTTHRVGAADQAAAPPALEQK